MAKICLRELLSGVYLDRIWRIVFIVGLGLLGHFTPVQADTSTEPITASNVERLSVQARFGRGLIHNVKWTEDGKSFIECTSTGLWIYDGQALDQPPHVLDGPVGCQTFAVNADGTLFAWISNDLNDRADKQRNIVFFADTKTGRQYQFALSTGNVASIAFSSDETLAAADVDGKVEVWQISTGQLIGTIDYLNLGKQTGTSYDKSIQISASNMVIEIRDAQTKRLTGQIFGVSGHLGRVDVQSVVFSPNRKLIAIVADGVTIYNARNGAVEAILAVDASAVAFSSDSKMLAVGLTDGSIKLWNVSPIGFAHITFKDQTDEIVSLAYSPDGTLASVSSNLTVHFWDMKTKQPLNVVHTGTLPLFRVRFSPDDKSFAATGNQRVYVWDAQTGNLKIDRATADTPQPFLKAQSTNPETFRGTNSLIETVFSDDSSRVFTSDASDQVTAWNSQTGQTDGKYQVVPGYTACFSSSERLFTVSQKRVRYFDFMESRQGTIDPQMKSDIQQIAVSTDGNTLAISNNDDVQVWDVETSQLKVDVPSNPGIGVDNLILNANGQLLAIIDSNENVGVWDTSTGKPLYQLDTLMALDLQNGVDLKNDLFPIPAAFNADGSLLAIGSPTTGTLYLWDTHNRVIARTLSLHRNAITDLSFNEDGSKLLTAGIDGAVYILALDLTMPF